MGIFRDGVRFVTERFWLGLGLAYYSVRTVYMMWGDVFLARIFMFGCRGYLFGHESAFVAVVGV